jgi:hypothetical protein
MMPNIEAIGILRVKHDAGDNRSPKEADKFKGGQGVAAPLRCCPQPAAHGQNGQPGDADGCGKKNDQSSSRRRVLQIVVQQRGADWHDHEPDNVEHHRHKVDRHHAAGQKLHPQRRG